MIKCFILYGNTLIAQNLIKRNIGKVLILFEIIIEFWNAYVVMNLAVAEQVPLICK